MAIRRFKMRKWDKHMIDYIEYDGKETYRIDPEDERILDGNTTMPLSSCKKQAEELPCYVRDLIEGDIAVIKQLQGTTTVYVFSGVGRRISMTSLSHKEKYWHCTKDRGIDDIEVLALIGNTFDSERLTYGVKRYVK